MKANNIKKMVIIACSTFIITIGIFTVSKTFGASNGTIYTRDELSSMINALEATNANLTTQNRELKKVGNSILIQSTFNNITSNNQMDVPNLSVTTSYDTSLYSFADNEITIKKAGYYLVIINGDFYFNNQPGLVALYCKHNDAIWIGTSISSSSFDASQANSTSRLAGFVANQTLTLSFLNFSSPIHTGYASLQVIYMGESLND